ncbi:glutamate decarboxylase [Duganella rhizosphaerae]|uniref:pyridoxal-dependent decarboxylase n=1 Tax=Duganella rhizosphaerae TaxID=2885763 RepID=UPI0030E916A5
MKNEFQAYFDVDSLANAPELLSGALRIMGDWLAGTRPQPYPTLSIAALKQRFDCAGMPAEGMPPEALLRALESEVFEHSIQLNHPKYIGHMTQALPWISVLAEAFIGALNQNQVKVETAYVSTLIEKQVIGWFHQLCYQNSEAYYADAFNATSTALGNMVSGGTTGNLTAMAVALERRLPGVRKHGLYAAMRQADCAGFAVLGSARIHYSMKKALATLGLGEEAIHAVPVDADNRVDLAALEQRIAVLKSRGIQILALVGIAGTTETGAIDPLEALAGIARREGAWFHVDAAWGGALMLSPAHRALYRGVELADSVVIDGHKLLWVSMAQSVVLFKDSASLNSLKHHANYIIRSSSGDLGQTSLEGSRRFDALKLWLSFKLLGTNGYAALLAQCARLAQSMQELIGNDEDFELISASPTFILTYRYVPYRMKRELAAYAEQGRLDQAAALNGYLNALNIALQTRQKETGLSFVSRTILESTRHGGDIDVLRIVLSNVNTSTVHLKEILAEQRLLGERLLQELARPESR